MTSVARQWNAAGRSLRARRAVVVVASIAAPVVLWFVAVKMLDVDLTVPSGDDGGTSPVGLGDVALAATAASLVLWIALTLLEQVTSLAMDVWSVSAIALILLTLGAGGMEGMRDDDLDALVAMHLAHTLTLVVGFRRATPANRG